jgi:hypothetical protein
VAKNIPQKRRANFATSNFDKLVPEIFGDIKKATIPHERP